MFLNDFFMIRKTFKMVLISRSKSHGKIYSVIPAILGELERPGVSVQGFKGLGLHAKRFRLRSTSFDGTSRPHRLVSEVNIFNRLKN